MIGNMLLLTTLELAVPLRISELQQRGGPKDSDREWIESRSEDLVARGDNLLYRTAQKDESARQLVNLVYTLAVLSFQPGGVDFGQLHFEVNNA